MGEDLTANRITASSERSFASLASRVVGDTGGAMLGCDHWQTLRQSIKCSPSSLECCQLVMTGRVCRYSPSRTVLVTCPGNILLVSSFLLYEHLQRANSIISGDNLIRLSDGDVHQSFAVR